MSLNTVMLIGHLGQAPELRRTAGGHAVCNFRLATNWRDKNGVESTDWHRIVAWDRTAETCGEYLETGSSVCVEGRLRHNKWRDKEGRDRVTTEVQAHRVHFLSGGKRRGEGNPGVGGRRTGQASGSASGPIPMAPSPGSRSASAPTPDDLPF